MGIILFRSREQGYARRIAVSRRTWSRKAGSGLYLAHENKFGKLLFVEFLHLKN
ncbi:MAG: hypothetical protein WBN88_06650 [Anderseniella sp.]